MATICVARLVVATAPNRAVRTRATLIGLGLWDPARRGSPARCIGRGAGKAAQSALALRPRDQMSVKLSPSSSLKRFA